MSNKKMILDTHEKPSGGKWVLLSLQHVFAMFGATILVPLLTGLNIGVALITSGIGTLIYILCTKAKVPIYLGSSFAYIAALSTAIGLGGVGAAMLGTIVVGLIYIVIAVVIRFVGTKWLHRLLPPVVIGPMIIIIGLGLAPVAISSSGLDGSSSYTYRELNQSELNTSDYYNGEVGDAYYFVEDGEIYSFNLIAENSYSAVSKFSTDKEYVYVYDSNPLLTDLEIHSSLYKLENSKYNFVKTNGNWIVPLVALITFIAVVLVALLAKGFLKVIPFIVAILVGYAAAAAFGVVDWSVFETARFFQLPNFTFIGTYKLDFSIVLMFIPLAFVTISEHIGDHVVLSEIVEKDFLVDPGLDRTLLGDGIATLFAGLVGGPSNTSYGENTSVVGLTKVASVWVTGLAAIIAVFLGFLGYIQAFISSIPWAVIGGITLVLYGFIAGNGVKFLIKAKTDLGDTRNLIIVSTMLVIGLGGAMINFSAVAGLSGMSLAAIVGIVLNLVLPKDKAVLPDSEGNENNELA